MFGELPMFIVMVCASICLLMESCRTAANISCALVMIAGMADAMYLHILPVIVDAASIVVTGAWAGLTGINGKNHKRIGFHVYRILSALAMAFLLPHHVEAMQMSSGQMPGMEMAGMDMPGLNSHQATGLGYIVLGWFLALAGLALTMIAFYKQKHRKIRFFKRLSLLEPSLMAFAILLMT